MKFQSLAISIFNECCLADVYIEAACRYNHTTLTDAKKAAVIMEAYSKGYVDEECFVKDPVNLMKLAVPGTSYTISKTDLSRCRGKFAAVRYRHNGRGHWTLFDTNTGLVYNGLDYSQCVANGVPVFDDVRDIVML